MKGVILSLLRLFLETKRIHPIKPIFDNYSSCARGSWFGSCDFDRYTHSLTHGIQMNGLNPSRAGGLSPGIC